MASVGLWLSMMFPDSSFDKALGGVPKLAKPEGALGFVRY